MNYLRRWSSIASAVVLLLGVVAVTLAAPPKVPAKPAEISISVSPEALSAGGEATISVQLTPIKGVKINRYPKIKLKVPAQSGLVDAAEAAVGNATPPPPDKLDQNYFKVVDPVELVLSLDAEAAKGEHQIEGKLSYAYCVVASGYCAPVRVPVNIPVTVN